MLKVSSTVNDNSDIYTSSDPSGGRVIKVKIVGGMGVTITVVANYSALPAPSTVAGQF